MRFKGLRVQKDESGTYEVVPLYHGKKGRTIVAPGMRQMGIVLAQVVLEVLKGLLARKDLKR